MIEPYSDHFQCRAMSYRRATVDELRAKFGDHFDWLLSQAHPAITARGRARGQWDANDLETMSAYERFAALVDNGTITAAMSRQKG